MWCSRYWTRAIPTRESTTWAGRCSRVRKGAGRLFPRPAQHYFRWSRTGYNIDFSLAELGEFPLNCTESPWIIQFISMRQLDRVDFSRKRGIRNIRGPYYTGGVRV